jgi:hypothetical protein
VIVTINAAIFLMSLLFNDVTFVQYVRPRGLEDGTCRMSGFIGVATSNRQTFAIQAQLKPSTKG